ncbi:MAG: iron-containing alcohol dehydrogenase, partial [Actinobacteria bacterium]|nr:iron-containing alcohol dehydrogenase [Actinomycetota bacterium]
LQELNNFSDIYINKALSAAKNPQLEMKLKNMPVSLNINNVEYYMKKILIAAKNGDLDLIENLG